jgi:hypothetical protein
MSESAPEPGVVTTDICSFPARRLDAAREALRDAHRRLVRAASRSDQDAPAEPQIAVTREGWASRCAECKHESDGVQGGRCEMCGGTTICRPVVDLRITWAPLRLAGWEFLAVVEPLIGGNLIRQVPDARIDEGELAAYRTGDLHCDHCRTDRRRSETFVVRADGSDERIPVGTRRCVGRSCLAAFLGRQSPAALISSLGWRDLIVQCGEAGGEGGWGGSDPHLESVEFLSWAVAVVRIDGWTSRTVARAQERSATADIAIGLLVPPHPSWRTEWERRREAYRPSDADRTRAQSILAWARDVSPGTDYEQNLRLVAIQPALDRSHAGILASAIAAHDRRMGERAGRRAEVDPGAPSRHLGAIGEKRDFGRVTCERIESYGSDYGTVHVHTFRDSEGRAIVWKTGKRRANQGDVVAALTGTIKRHGEFRGEAQTELSRCALLSESDLAARSAPKAKRPRAKKQAASKSASAGAPPQGNPSGILQDVT